MAVEVDEDVLPRERPDLSEECHDGESWREDVNDCIPNGDDITTPFIQLNPIVCQGELKGLRLLRLVRVILRGLFLA